MLPPARSIKEMTLIKIREDLEGVVVVTAGPGATITLAAGDDVPEGVEVGEHLLGAEPAAEESAEAAEESPADEPEAPAEESAEESAEAAEAPAKAAGPYATAPKSTRARKA